MLPMHIFTPQQVIIKDSTLAVTREEVQYWWVGAAPLCGCYSALP
jgi:hypothetical protein